MKWNPKRWHISATMINDDKLICCGGMNNYLQYVDLFDFKTQKLTKLERMNEKRRYSGIWCDKFNIDKVYIGGGSEAPKKFEYYNVVKNKWILLHDTTQKHNIRPIIWNEHNPNIIFIASMNNYCKLIEQIDIRQNEQI